MSQYYSKSKILIFHLTKLASPQKERKHCNLCQVYFQVEFSIQSRATHHDSWFVMPHPMRHDTLHQGPDHIQSQVRQTSLYMPRTTWYLHKNKIVTYFQNIGRLAWTNEATRIE